MRNQYGIWNQQRWLRSARTEFFADKATPAPLERQPYFARMRELANQSSEFYGGRKPQSDKPNKSAAAKSAKGKGKDKDRDDNKSEAVASAELTPQEKRDGMDVRYVKDAWVPERYFDKDSYWEWKAVVANRADFESVVPAGDPYRLERELGVYASGDLRYFLLNVDKEAVLSGQKMRTSLMAADIGVRLRPTKYHQFSGVIEARFLNAPENQDLEDGFTQSARVKSAYLLADDLLYNSFFQAGIYRPMFGHYDPDHDSVSSKLTGLDQRAAFKGFAFGTAPNVPFLIVNYISPYKLTGTESETSKGYVVTAGARFVTYGASASASLWNTDYKVTTVDWKRQMYAVEGGFSIKDFIANVEFARVQKSSSTGTKNAGTVYTFKGKYRLWRENFLVANFGSANTALDLTEGSASETMLGFKSFPISSTEIEALYIMRKQNDGGTPIDYNLIQLQAHLFF